MTFDFATAGRILFGPGRLQESGTLASELGTKALLVTGSAVERAAALEAILQHAGIEMERFTTEQEPTIAVVQRGRKIALATSCDLVIGFGGGSAIDAGKAIAALVTNGEDPLEFLEVIGEGKPLIEQPLPYIAIPTTAGTGSEVTRNAVLKSEAHQVKVSLRSAAMLPRIALVDPELTYSSGGSLDPADLIITFQAPSAGVPVWQFTGADLGWSGTGTRRTRSWCSRISSTDSRARSTGCVSPVVIRAI